MLDPMQFAGVGGGGGGGGGGGDQQDQQPPDQNKIAGLLQKILPQLQQKLQSFGEAGGVPGLLFQGAGSPPPGQMQARPPVPFQGITGQGPPQAPPQAPPPPQQPPPQPTPPPRPAPQPPPDGSPGFFGGSPDTNPLLRPVGDQPPPRPGPGPGPANGPPPADAMAMGDRLPGPANAPVRAPIAPAPAAEPQQQFTGPLNRLINAGGFPNIAKFLEENRNQFGAIGAGMGGQSHWSGGLSRTMEGMPAAIARDQQQGVMNDTIRALMKKNMSFDEARMIATNPEVMKQVIPQLFGGKQGININNRLVDPATGRVIADLSGDASWQPKEITLPTGEKQTVMVQGSTGQMRAINPSEMSTTTGAGRPPRRVTTFEEALRLPKGERFIDPNGVERVR